MDTEPDILQSVYFRAISVFLSLFGVWPYRERNQRYLLRLNHVLIGSTICIPTICKMIEKIRENDEILWAIPSQLFYVENYLKCAFLIVKENEVKSILDRIRSDFQSRKNQNLDILYRYAEDARTFNFVYAVYMMTSTISYSASVWTPAILDFIVPLNESRPRPIPRLMRYYWDRIDDNYNFIVIHGMAVDTFLLVHLMSFDMLFVSCAQHACALFRVVVNELENCMNARQEIDGKDEKICKLHREKFYDEIARVIVMHENALEFADMVNSTYSLINLFILGISLVTITLTEYEAVIHLNDNSGLMIRFTFFTVGVLLHILYYNYSGQRLEEHSLEVYQSCYNCEWYREDVSNKCRGLLKLMIARSQLATNFTAGKIIVLGLESFAKILKTSVSFFTVLLSVH